MVSEYCVHKANMTQFINNMRPLLMLTKIYYLATQSNL